MTKTKVGNFVPRIWDQKVTLCFDKNHETATRGRFASHLSSTWNIAKPSTVDNKAHLKHRENPKKAHDFEYLGNVRSI